MQLVHDMHIGRINLVYYLIQAYMYNNIRALKQI